MRHARFRDPDGKEDDGGVVDAAALRWFAGLVRPYAGRLTVAGVAVALSSGVSLGVPLVAGRVVDAAVLTEASASMDRVILALLGLFAASSALDFVETYILRQVSAELLLVLRTRLHAHLLGLAPGFFEAQRTGDLLSRLNSDVEVIGATLTDQLVSGAQQLFVLVGALLILLSYDVRLTGVMLLAVPPVVIAAVLLGRRLRRYSVAEREAVADANVAAEEAFAGVRTVQAFVQEPHERARFSARLGVAVVAMLKAARAWGLFRAMIRFFAFAALSLVLWQGGKLVRDGSHTPGQLASFLMYTMTVAGGFGALTALYGQFRSAAGATQRVRQLLDTKATISDPPDPLPLSRPQGALALEGVSFAYPSNPGKKALDGVTLEVAPGTCVALVGPSGAGKSTVASLLLRFHDPLEGRVLLDGVDVRRHRLAELRGAIGLVPQDIMLFGGTVAENIRYGRPGATDAEVQAAAEAAQAHRFIDALPQKYESVVGERGVKLSGGERQRLAIARVLLKDPRIVVLDEATSSLDSESEHLIQRAFDRLLEGRTTVVIAHRLTTVRRASKVVVLDGGQVLAAGPHDQLIAESALYRRLCELQMLTVAPQLGVVQLAVGHDRSTAEARRGSSTS